MRWAFLAIGLSASLAAAEERATFVFSLDSTPVGLIELGLDPASSTFRYRSMHWLTRDTHVGSIEQKLEMRTDGPRMPASLWLWMMLGTGCVPVEDERTHRQGEGCIAKVRGSEVDGSLFGEAFHARYSGKGRLEHLQIGASDFNLREGVATLEQAPPDLFGKPVAVRGQVGNLRWEPALPPPKLVTAQWDAASARRLSLKVMESFTESTAGDADLAVDAQNGTRGGCLAHARRFERWARTTSGVRRAAVVLGFYAPESDRSARAHAWVAVRTPQGILELDPTLGIPVSPKTHVAVGSEYLSVFRGERHLLRVEP